MTRNEVGAGDEPKKKRRQGKGQVCGWRTERERIGVIHRQKK